MATLFWTQDSYKQEKIQPLCATKRAVFNVRIFLCGKLWCWYRRVFNNRSTRLRLWFLHIQYIFKPLRIVLFYFLFLQPQNKWAMLFNWISPMFSFNHKWANSTARSEVSLTSHKTFKHATHTWSGVPIIAANMDTIETCIRYYPVTKV